MGSFLLTNFETNNTSYGSHDSSVYLITASTTEEDGRFYSSLTVSLARSRFLSHKHTRKTNKTQTVVAKLEWTFKFKYVSQFNGVLFLFLFLNRIDIY